MQIKENLVCKGWGRALGRRLGSATAVEQSVNAQSLWYDRTTIGTKLSVLDTNGSLSTDQMVSSTIVYWQLNQCPNVATQCKLSNYLSPNRAFKKLGQVEIGFCFFSNLKQVLLLRGE